MLSIKTNFGLKKKAIQDFKQGETFERDGEVWLVIDPLGQCEDRTLVKWAVCLSGSRVGHLSFINYDTCFAEVEVIAEAKRIPQH